MAKGDHIKVSRGLYWHHGIDLGDGTVAHSSGEPFRERDAVVKQSSLEDFCRGCDPTPVHPPDAYGDEVVVRRALSKLGCRDYHLLLNNCEHFATWCKTGRRRSRQVEGAARAGMVAGYATRLVAGTIAARGSSVILARVAALAGPAGLAMAVAGVSISVFSRARREMGCQTPPLS